MRVPHVCCSLPPAQLARTFQKHVFVGVIDAERSVFQHDTALMMANHVTLTCVMRAPCACIAGANARRWSAGAS